MFYLISLFDGPFIHLPSLSNLEPWQGQSKVSSTSLYNNLHPRCGHTYLVDLGNNCHISKLYSEYAIEKAYNSEVVSENRVYLMLVMLTTKVLKLLLTLPIKGRPSLVIISILLHK